MVKNVTINAPSAPTGCSFYTEELGGNYTFTFNSYAESNSMACGASKGAAKLAGSTKSLTTFTAELDIAKQLATLTITGPASVWFAVGLGAQVMKDTPNAIVILPNGTVFEQKLADQSPGTRISTSVTVVSSTVAAGRRTVVLTRPLAGATRDHYTFDTSKGTLPFINAVGSSAVFAYHKARSAATMAFHTLGADTCVCDTGDVGYISSDMNPGLTKLTKHCAPEPASDLVKLHNPTCTIEQYQGGLLCCTSGNILLDKDQNPWKENKLVYYMKWRFCEDSLTQFMRAAITPSFFRFPGCFSVCAALTKRRRLVYM